MGLRKGMTPKNIALLIEKGKVFQFKKGSIPWCAGKNLSEKTKMKIRLSKIGKPSMKKGKTYEHKRTYKICPSCKEKFTDMPYRMKIKKYCCSKCANQNITPAKLKQREKFKLIGKQNAEKKYSKIHKFNISLAKKQTWLNPKYRILKLKQMEQNWKENTLLRSGKNSPMWKGGISGEPYGSEFNESLKRKIRERDGYTCQLCLLRNEFVNFPVHHIDYNKQTNKPWNLITLCPRCHIKTNTHRENWKFWFSGIMFEKYKNLYINEINSKDGILKNETII